GRLAHGIGQTLDATQAAAAGAGETALAPRDALQAVRRQPHAQLHTFRDRDDVEFLDVRGTAGNAFGETEAQREVFQIRRGRQPPRIGGAVIGQRTGGLLGDRGVPPPPAAIAEDGGGVAVGRWPHALLRRPRLDPPAALGELAVLLLPLTRSVG